MQNDSQAISFGERTVGDLAASLSHMRHDHDDHGTKLRRLDEITNGFKLTEGACRSWQALYVGTRKLADDLRDHIHLENNILFPRFETLNAHSPTTFTQPDC